MQQIRLLATILTWNFTQCIAYQWNGKRSVKKFSQRNEVGGWNTLGAHLLHRNNHMHGRHFQYITSSTLEVPVDWWRLFIDISQNPTHTSPGMCAPQHSTQTHTAPPEHQCQNAQVGLAASVPLLANSCRVFLSLPLFPPHLTEHISELGFPKWEHK